MEFFVELSPGIESELVGSDLRGKAELHKEGVQLVGSDPVSEVVGERLAGLRKPGAHEAREEIARRARGGRSRNQLQDDAFDFGGWIERTWRDSNHLGDLERVLHQDAEGSGMGVASLGEDSRSDFELHHEDGSGEEVSDLGDLSKQWAGDVVRHVGDQGPGLGEPSQVGPEVGQQDIPKVDFCLRGRFGESRDRDRIELPGDELLGLLTERSREGPRPRTDF